MELLDMLELSRKRFSWVNGEEYVRSGGKSYELFPISENDGAINCHLQNYNNMLARIHNFFTASLDPRLEEYPAADPKEDDFSRKDDRVFSDIDIFSEFYVHYLHSDFKDEYAERRLSDRAIAFIQELDNRTRIVNASLPFFKNAGGDREMILDAVADWSSMVLLGYKNNSYNLIHTISMMASMEVYIPGNGILILVKDKYHLAKDRSEYSRLLHLIES